MRTRSAEPCVRCATINIPTQITLARICFLPVILIFYILAVVTPPLPFFAQWGRLVSVSLFVIAAATDWLDGYLARKWNQVTNTGKLLDPVADKMLTLLGFLLVLSDPIWLKTSESTVYYVFLVPAVFIALGRDVITNSLRFIAAEQGIVIAADRLGKIKTICQFIALTLFMLLAFNLALPTPFLGEGGVLYAWAYTAVGVLALSTVFSIWSCVNYIRNYARQASAKQAK